MKVYKSICKVCNQDKWLQNSRGVCPDCVYKQNHNGKDRFEVAREKKAERGAITHQLKRMPLKSSKLTQTKRVGLLKKDREFYFHIFNTKPHECEECCKPLPVTFEDENKNIVYIGQYSHILSKGSYPELRHHRLNMNRLCLKCHDLWEFGDKKKMEIYPLNLVLIEKMKNFK